MADDKKSTELESQKKTTVPQVSMDGLDDIGNAGISEDVEDRGTPLLYIAQKSSPHVDEKAAEFIEGLKPGMAFNNLTGRFWDAEKVGVELYPCYFRANWVEWTPRDEGGGFHGMHPRMSPEDLREKLGARQKEDRRDIYTMPNGHELVLTHHYFCILAGLLQPIVVPMSSTNLKASQMLQAIFPEQQWTEDDRKFFNDNFKDGVPNWPRPAPFMRKFCLKTVYASNDLGNWYKWSPSILGPNHDVEAVLECSKFARACKANEVEIAAPNQDGAADNLAGEVEVPI